MVEPVAPDPGVTVPETSADRSAIRLYTEHYLIRGRLATPGELTSVLNAAGERLELEAAVYDEFGSREIVAQVPWVEVNLGLVLIAALDEEWAPAAEIVAAQARDEVLVGLPPFRVTGRLASRGAGSSEFRPAAELQRLVNAAGVTKGRRVIAYDTTGVGAAKLAFALALLGYEDVGVYDGGWAEWGERTDLPIER